MITDESADETEQVCPHLRLAGDPSTWSPDPSPENRCYRPVPVHGEHQAEWCLADGHFECPGAPPIGSGTHRTGTRLILGRQRVTRREAEELVRTVLVTVAVMGLLLVVFTGVVISGRAKVDGNATLVASAGAEEGGATAGRGDAERNESPLTGGEAGVGGREGRSGEAPASIAGTPADTQPAAGWLSPSYDGTAEAPDVPPQDTTEPEPVAAEDDTVYVIQQGDTLYSLARAHGVTVDALMEANDLEDQHSIKAGQRITIPDSTPVP